MKIRNLLMALIAMVFVVGTAFAEPAFTLKETIKSLSSDYPGDVKIFQVKDGNYTYTVQTYPGKELVKFPSYKPSQEYKSYWESLVKQGLANTYLAYRADLWQKFAGTSVDNNVYPGAWRTVSAMTPLHIPCRPMIYGSRANGGTAEGFTRFNKLEEWNENSNSYSFLLTGRVWEQFSTNPQCLAFFVSQYNLVRDGQDGKDGKNGNDGRNGRDGIDGRSVVRVNIEDNQWVVYYSDGKREELGQAPRNGENGANGINGTNGVSVTGALVDEQGNLVLTLSNGSKIDAGNIKGQNGKDGKGIASTKVVECKLIVTYSDGSQQDAGSVCQGGSSADGAIEITVKWVAMRSENCGILRSLGDDVKGDLFVAQVNGKDSLYLVSYYNPEENRQRVCYYSTLNDSASGWGNANGTPSYFFSWGMGKSRVDFPVSVGVPRYNMAKGWVEIQPGTYGPVVLRLVQSNK